MMGITYGYGWRKTVVSKRDAACSAMLWRAEDIIMDADHGESQPVGGREKNAAKMHTRLVIEILLQEIEIMMKSEKFAQWVRFSSFKFFRFYHGLVIGTPSEVS